MPYVVLIDKTGEVSDSLIKNFNEEELYKKVGLKNPKHFECVGKECWKMTYDKQPFVLSVYGKTDGRESTINKFEFPPPLDVLPTSKPHIYGTVVIVNRDEKGNVQDIRSKQWLAIYEQLLGGIDDLDEESDEESDEETPVNPDKNGYEKDGFIVSDDEEEEEDDEDDDEDEDDDDEDDDDDDEDDDADEDDEDDEDDDDVEGANPEDAVEELELPRRKSTRKKTKNIIVEDYDCEDELDFEEYFE